MSQRLPPVPPASKPVHGPDGVPKTSEDITHRVRHQAQRAQQQQASAHDVIRPPAAGDDLGGAVPAGRNGSDTWMLAATGAVVAAIVWLANRQKSGAA